MTAARVREIGLPSATAPWSGLDINANRRARKWSRRALAGRALWAVARPLFLFSPRLCWGWRRGMLRLFGARIGRKVQIFPNVRIAIPWNVSIGDESAVGDGVILYSLGPIRIGSQVTISQYAHLCAGTHDFTRADMALRKPPIAVEDGAWICTDAFVGPGVTVGAGTVVGARSVVMRDIAPGLVVAGNPARILRERPGSWL